MEWLSTVVGVLYRCARSQLIVVCFNEKPLSFRAHLNLAVEFMCAGACIPLAWRLGGAVLCKSSMCRVSQARFGG